MFQDFIRYAPLVIPDEPTAALDAKAEHELFARIGELFAERSVVPISHRFSTVRSADRIHEELITVGGTYAELFTLQASPYQYGLPPSLRPRVLASSLWRRSVIDLKPACHRMIDVLAGVADDQLTSASPCTEYTVGDLIDHVDLVSRGAAALTELVVHGWDIATATGQPFDLPEHTLQACLEHVTAFVPNAPVPGLWGPSVDVAADAVLLDRILAITGRAP